MTGQPWLCQVLPHMWARWTEPTARRVTTQMLSIVGGSFSEDTLTQYIQERTCARCGLSERRLCDDV